MLITKDGKPVAALVDADLFERIRRLREDFQQLTDTLGQSYAGVDPAIAEAEVVEAVSSARRATPAPRGARKRR